MHFFVSYLPKIEFQLNMMMTAQINKEIMSGFNIDFLG